MIDFFHVIASERLAETMFERFLSREFEVQEEHGFSAGFKRIFSFAFFQASAKALDFRHGVVFLVEVVDEREAQQDFTSFTSKNTETVDAEHSISNALHQVKNL